MPEVILSEEQVEAVKHANGDVIVRGPNGAVLGRFVRSCFSPEQIAEARRLVNSGEPTRTTAEVWERIHALERT